MVWAGRLEPPATACVLPLAKLIRVATGRFGGVGTGVGTDVDVGSGPVVGNVVGLASGVLACRVPATIVATSSEEEVDAAPQASVVKIKIATASLIAVLNFIFLLSCRHNPDVVIVHCPGYDLPCNYINEMPGVLFLAGKKPATDYADLYRIRKLENPWLSLKALYPVSFPRRSLRPRS